MFGKLEFNIKNIVSALSAHNLIEDSMLYCNTLKPNKIQVDSRKVEKGDVFIAFKGEHVDSNSFISDVIKKEPSLIITDSVSTFRDLIQTYSYSLNFIHTLNPRLAWTVLESLYYNNPQNDICLIGITGTNGKTSSVWFIKELLSKVSIPSLCIGTLGIFLDKEHFPSAHTTPDPDVLFKYLNMAREKKIKYCIMEVSSHSIAQSKVSVLKFDIVAFTSFSQDHLDFHSDMKSYFDTKALLFTTLLKPKGQALICSKVIDSCDSYGIDIKKMSSNLPKSSKLSFYGYTPYKHELFSNYRIKEKSSDLNLSTFSLNNSATISVNLFGQHTLENFTLALIICSILDKKHFDLNSSHLFNLKSVPGRLEKINDTNIFVDYAHTPDGMEKTLSLLKKLTPSSQKLICVFGCGGDRDKTKRPLMAKVSEKYCDRVYVTNDNPRTENPDSIIKDIMSGFSDSFKPQVSTNTDRSYSIKEAILNSDKNDVVCICGKGHEDYMILGTQKIYFDDRVEARKAMDEKLVK